MRTPMVEPPPPLAAKKPFLFSGWAARFVFDSDNIKKMKKPNGDGGGKPPFF